MVTFKSPGFRAVSGRLESCIATHGRRNLLGHIAVIAVLEELLEERRSCPDALMPEKVSGPARAWVRFVSSRHPGKISRGTPRLGMLLTRKRQGTWES